MIEETEDKLRKEEYTKAGLYGKIVTIPDLIKIITEEGNKNSIVKTILNSYNLKNSVLGYKKWFGLDIHSDGYEKWAGLTICSDGMKRMYIPSPIKGISIDIISSPIEVLIVDSEDQNKCHSIKRYITYDHLENILLTDEERLKVKTIRLSLNKQRIMKLFKSGYNSITTDVIRSEVGLRSDMFDPALCSLISEKILKEVNGIYVLNKEK